MHGSDPTVSLKVPGTHAVQSAPPLPMKPALHMQFAMVLEPCSIDNVFAGHMKHAAEPVFDLNLPAAHCAHALPFAPVNPALH